MKTFETNRIIRGNYGRVWMNGERMANVKSFEAKVTLNYEDVELMIRWERTDAIWDLSLKAR